jgi:homoserine kinase type II
MTVWTHVTLEEANAWLAERDLGKARTITPIESGVEDSAFRLVLEDGNPVFLRLFERTEPCGPLEIAARLAAHGLPTNPPIQDREQRLLVTLKNKPAALYPWVEGDWIPDPSLVQIGAIGEFLGRMGRVGMDYCADWTRENPRGLDWLEKTAGDLSSVLDGDENECIQAEVSLQLAYWESPETSNLLRGPIHGDLFRNNVMWDVKGNLAAVIDWGFCTSGCPPLFDLAIVANDWCLQENSSELDQNKLAALMRGRCSILPLTDGEKKAWPMALRWAALRFYLSRLYDFHLPRSGKRLNPGCFREILRARQKL